MSNNKFVKLFRVNGAEVLFRKNCEMVDGKQYLSIQVHCYFDEFIPLGYIPEATTKIPVCCLKHLDQNFEEINGEKAKEICELLRIVANKNKQKFMTNLINHN
jgi:hypothetical protein